MATVGAGEDIEGQGDVAGDELKVCEEDTGREEVVERNGKRCNNNDEDAATKDNADVANNTDSAVRDGDIDDKDTGDNDINDADGEEEDDDRDGIDDGDGEKDGEGEDEGNDNLVDLDSEDKEEHSAQVECDDADISTEECCVSESNGEVSDLSEGKAASLAVDQDVCGQRPGVECAYFSSDCYAHHSHLARGMQHFREHRKLTDITLVCDGQEFPAHTMLLIIQCPYFEALLQPMLAHHDLACDERPYFMQQNCLRVAIDLCKAPVLHLLLTYLYQGHCPLTRHTVLDLLCAAHETQLPALKMLCEDYVIEQSLITITNFKLMYQVMTRVHSDRLLTATSYFLRTHIEQVLSQGEWDHMDISDVKLILGDDELLVQHEQQVYEAALQWLHHDIPNRSRLVGEVMSCVRFSQMPADYLVHTVQRELYMQSDVCQKLVLHALSSMLCPSARSQRQPHQRPRTGPRRQGVLCLAVSQSGHVSTLVYEMWARRWHYLSSPHCTEVESSLVHVDNIVYVCGGRSSIKSSSLSAATYMYDLLNDTWDRLSDMLSPRIHHQCVALGGRWYVLGGYDQYQAPGAASPASPTPSQTCSNYLNNMEKHFCRRVDCYDVPSRHWFEVSILPRKVSASNLHTFTCGCNIYCYSGVSNVMRYNVQTDAWESVTFDLVGKHPYLDMVSVVRESAAPHTLDMGSAAHLASLNLLPSHAQGEARGCHVPTPFTIPQDVAHSNIIFYCQSKCEDILVYAINTRSKSAAKFWHYRAASRQWCSIYFDSLAQVTVACSQMVCCQIPEKYFNH